VPIIVFNEFNARSIDSNPNVLRGLFSNPIFLAIIGFTVAMQWGIIEFGGEFVKTEPLTAQEWYWSVLLAALTLPVGGIMRILPVWTGGGDGECAPTSALIAHKQRSSQQQGGGALAGLLSPSGLCWVAVVALVCHLNYKEFFSSMWEPKLAALAAAMAQ
jgi:hypothetical protein